MKSLNGIRLLVISAVVLAVAVASIVVVMMLSTRSTHSALAGMPMDMPGMDMSGSSPASTPSATMDPNMPGMDMSGSSPASTPSATMDPNMPGMDMSGSTPAPNASPDAHGEMDMPGTDSGSGDAHGTSPGHSSMATEASADRPLVPVLGTFGGGTAAVLFGAGLLRRKDREASQAKQAARAARRSAK